eukprot:CAMPEP_0172526948 /NCGR_PEP_ID=MMETSP1067-20121228/1766_1 /TAXON_ID=265564 ORGANISM="Thalassiosira punctigera, Strain Tpunct2005C2" /NCGR_SAMPLE_ID=MMETSP1067 /ASSEMBLY_ACC=CAM_ASM_000444 /LENGTH=573 /DNA_ID=CAMNT_0013310589 /DNA_START=96 /DNA_END=1817 /DNA_ORIENTATION=+
MTVSSFRNAALASVLSAAAVSGQQVIFIPMSSSSSSSSASTTTTMTPRRDAAVNMDPFLFGSRGSAAGEEPPCRKRRLEPWRVQVRDRCLAEVNSHCPASAAAETVVLVEPTREGDEEEPPMVARDLRRREWKEPQPRQQSDLEREVESFFQDLFAPPRVRLSSSPPSGSLPGHDGGEDPLDRILNDVLGFSLRAFDQMMMADATDPLNPPSPPLTLVEGEGGEEGEDGVETTEADSWSEDADPPSPFSQGSESEDYAALTPEQVAENALDVMVASLARSAAASSGSNDVATEEEEQEDEVGWEEVGLPAVENLPQRLFQIGQDLLSETHYARRRLSEGRGGEADSRLQAKERLARRLTEYRTNLVYSPDGNTVTLYTSSSNFHPSSPFAPASPFSGGMTPITRMMAFSPVLSSPYSVLSSLTYSPPLGMGSKEVDECLRSRFDDGALKGTGCHQAVGELLLAVDHGSPTSHHYAEFASPTISTGFAVTEYAVEVQEDLEGCPHAPFVGLAMLLCGMCLVYRCFGESSHYEFDDEEEDEFGYATLEEEGAEGGCRPNGEGGARVFVGVPVQVV